jgi:hypothetical protein
VRADTELRTLKERINLLEAEIERMRETEHALRGQMASMLPSSWFHEVLDRREVPRERAGRRLTITQRLDWLGGKRDD